MWRWLSWGGWLWAELERYRVEIGEVAPSSPPTCQPFPLPCCRPPAGGDQVVEKCRARVVSGNERTFEVRRREGFRRRGESWEDDGASDRRGGAWAEVRCARGVAIRGGWQSYQSSGQPSQGAQSWGLRRCQQRGKQGGEPGGGTHWKAGSALQHQVLTVCITQVYLDFTESPPGTNWNTTRSAEARSIRWEKRPIFSWQKRTSGDLGTLWHGS